MQEKAKARKIADWPTKMLEKATNSQYYENMYEMVQWRSISQEGIVDVLWKELCGNMEVDAEKSAHQGGGEP